MSSKTLISFNYENILKSIATASNECTAKQENKANYYTKVRLKKKIFIIVKTIVLTKN